METGGIPDRTGKTAVSPIRREIRRPYGKMAALPCFEQPKPPFRTPSKEMDGECCMYIVIDCETTGLPRNWKAPVSDVQNWPRLVQVAWSRIDGNLEKVDEEAFLVRPWRGFPSGRGSLHSPTRCGCLKLSWPITFASTRVSYPPNISVSAWSLLSEAKREYARCSGPCNCAGYPVPTAISGLRSRNCTVRFLEPKSRKPMMRART